MPESTPVEKIRSAITAQLASLGANDTDGLRESILIRAGLYCGRRYQCDGFEVVWFIEEDELKFFGPDGTLHWASNAVQCLAKFESQLAAQNTTQPRAA